MFFLSNYATNKASYDLNELITHNEMYIKKELYRKESYINYQNPNFDRDMMFREDFHFQRWFDAISTVAIEPVDSWLGANFEYTTIQSGPNNIHNFYNKGDMEKEYIKSLNTSILKRYKDIASLEARYEKFNCKRDYHKAIYYDDFYIEHHKYKPEIFKREKIRLKEKKI